MTSDNYSNLKGLLEDVIIPSAGKSLKEIGGIELLDIQGSACNIKIALNYHDNNIDDYKWKCEIVDAGIMFDNVTSESFFKEFNDKQCNNLNPTAEWRKYWYDEKERPY